MKPSRILAPLKVIATSTLLLAAAVTVPAIANAASVTGTMALAGGGYTLTGGSDFSDATGISFNSTTIVGTYADNDLGTTVSIGSLGTVANFDFDPLASAIAGFIEIGGWSFQLDTATAQTPRSTAALFLSGTGTLSGNGYDQTQALWSFSSNNLNDYSMTITAVPVPAAVWLFLSGLLGVVGIARRKAT